MSPAQAPVRPRVFISYAHADGVDLAQRLAHDLSQDLYVWFDRERLDPDARWQREIERQVDLAHILVAVVSKGSFDSDMCRCEIHRARRKRKAIVLLVADRTADWSLIVEDLTPLYADSDSDYQNSIQSIHKAASRIGASEAPPISQLARQQPFNVPQLPLHFVDRPDMTDALIAELVNESSERRTMLWAFKGEGGIGKTVLAQAVCHSDVVRDAFPDGVIFTVLGREVSKSALLKKLLDVIAALGGEVADCETVRSAQSRLQVLLEKKAVLLVVDDVWDTSHSAPFLVEGKRCRVLMTTREVTAPGARVFDLGRMDRAQARQLLCGWTGLADAELPDTADALIESALGRPVELAMLGAALRGKDATGWAELVANRGAIGVRVKRVAEHRVRGGIETTGEVTRLQATPVDNSIRAVLGRLDAEDRRRYLELAIFGEDTRVPVAVLQVLWGMDTQSVEALLTWYAELALVQREAGTVALHDLQFDYADRELTDKPAVHSRLVDNYRERCASKWWELPDDGYVSGALAGHLHAAGRAEELRALLFEPRWMRRRLKSENAAALTDDLRLFDGIGSPDENDAVRWLSEVLNGCAFRLYGHPDLLTGQLVGRLMPVREKPLIAQLLERCRATEPGCWLEPTTQSLDPVGFPLLHTPEVHTGPVISVAVTHDGHRAVSGSVDNTLKVWDLEAGHEIRTLTGHTGPVISVAVTQDGRRAVSGSDDHTLKVWNLETGLMIHSLEVHSDSVVSVAVTPDGRRAVSESCGRILRACDLESGKWVNPESWAHDPFDFHQRFLPRRYLHFLKLVDTRSDSAVAGFCADADIYSAAYSTPSKTLVAGDADGRVHILRLCGQPPSQPQPSKNSHLHCAQPDTAI